MPYKLTPNDWIFITNARENVWCRDELPMAKHHAHLIEFIRRMYITNEHSFAKNTVMFWSDYERLPIK